MSTCNILVVGHEQHPQTRHQLAALHQAGARAILLDPYGQQGKHAALYWREAQILWDGQDISPAQIQAVLVSALAPEVPTCDAFTRPVGQQLGWADWHQEYGLQRDRSDTLLSLLLTYEMAGVPLFNPVAHTLASARKAYQLRQLQMAGCRLPNTLITSDPRAAAAFIREQGDCIVKPAGGGALTLSANEVLLKGELEQVVAPAIFQQRIVGEDIRVIVLKDRIISSAAVELPPTLLDFRSDARYQRGEAAYRNVTLPRIVQLHCRRAAMMLGLHFAGIDLKCDEQGEYYLLECDSSPVYLDVEQKLGHAISGALAQALCEAC